MSTLALTDVSIRFGGLQALDEVTLAIEEHEIVGLIGPNGAGKTTLFNCISGFLTPDRGRVVYKGQDVTLTPPHRKAMMGIARTFQNVGMAKSLTVLQNLQAAQHLRARYGIVGGIVGSSRSRSQERVLQQRAEQILEFLGLADIRDARVAGLPYGNLKLLELGCSLAMSPDLLLLDEPSSGLGPDEADQLGDRLLAIRRDFGLTMLLIEHHVPLVARVCDYIYVLNFGQLLAEGKPAAIQRHPEVVAAYLGGEAPEVLAETHSLEEESISVPAARGVKVKGAR